MTAGFTATGPPTKLSVGVLHRVSSAGDDGLLSNCKCDGTAVNGGSSGLSSTLATFSESTTRKKASQGMGWYKTQLDAPLLGLTLKFSAILSVFPRFLFSWGEFTCEETLFLTHRVRVIVEVWFEKAHFPGDFTNFFEKCY